MFRGMLGRIPTESEVTRVSAETEVGIPAAQAQIINRAAFKILVALLADVLLLGPVLGGELLALCAVVALGYAFLRMTNKYLRVAAVTSILIVCIAAILWLFVGHRWSRAFWPIPHCAIERAAEAIWCDADGQCWTDGNTEWWLVCNGHALLERKGLLALPAMLSVTHTMRIMAQWVRWLLLAYSVPFVAFNTLLIVALAYDVATKGDYRKPGEHWSPYWWQFLFNPLMRRATKRAWLDSVNVRVRDLSPVHRADFWLHLSDHRHEHYSLDLTDSQWNNLRSLAIAGESFSEAGLANVGFSSGPHGEARIIKEKLKEAQVLTMKGRRLVAIPEFAAWLKNYGWRK